VSKFFCALKRALLVPLVLFASLLASNSHAQQIPSQQMAAVMSVINTFLLDRPSPIPMPGGLGVPLTLGELSPNTFVVTENVFAQFDLQEEGIELCFIIDSANVINPGDLTVEVNGEPVEISLGENCFTLTEAEQRVINYINFIVNTPGITVSLTTLELAPSAQTQLTLARLTRGSWDESAVRKVLKIFAFGGHATTEQIIAWSNMSSQDAIAEMLTFDEHNLLLSPLAIGETYTETANMHGTLTDFVDWISDDASNLPIPIGNFRNQFSTDSSNFDDGFNRMITIRGLNPFRQRIGFWETNYHLATNLSASVSRPQMALYYDLIMQAHESGVPYHEVLGVAAKSAAAAMQYGHRNNRWNNFTMECECNDDFAREIHQLYYGIFGVGDPNHEDFTIPETAKMLTDMPVPFISGFGFQLTVNFETDDHFPGAVNIFDPAIYPLAVPIVGVDAEAKIDNLMPISIQHPESLQNLPVMIISVLADDNLDEARKDQLRTAWAALGVNKSFLDFIHAYAVSSLFHSPDQFKFFTTHERAFYLANKNDLDTLEALYGGTSFGGGDRAGRTVGSVVSEDNAGDFFRPLHNVFGGQTSFEASDSALSFENNFNRLTDDEHHLREAVECNSCDIGAGGVAWEKKWPMVLPQRADGEFYVEDVAEWLWMHVVGNLDNYTELEKAHLYSLLGAARILPGSSSDNDQSFDFNLLMCLVEDYQAKGNTDISVANLMSNNVYNDFCRRGNDGAGGVFGFSDLELAAINRVYTGADIVNDLQIQGILTDLGNITLPLNANTGANGGADLREHARERVNSALGFIFTTPFVFAEGQQ